MGVAEGRASTKSTRSLYSVRWEFPGKKEEKGANSKTKKYRWKMQVFAKSTLIKYTMEIGNGEGGEGRGGEKWVER